MSQLASCKALAGIGCRLWSIMHRPHDVLIIDLSVYHDASTGTKNILQPVLQEGHPDPFSRRFCGAGDSRGHGDPGYIGGDHPSPGKGGREGEGQIKMTTQHSSSPLAVKTTSSPGSHVCGATCVYLPVHSIHLSHCSLCLLLVKIITCLYTLLYLALFFRLLCWLSQ